APESREVRSLRGPNVVRLRTLLDVENTMVRRTHLLPLTIVTSVLALTACSAKAPSNDTTAVALAGAPVTPTAADNKHEGVAKNLVAAAMIKSGDRVLV